MSADVVPRMKYYIQGPWCSDFETQMTLLPFGRSHLFQPSSVCSRDAYARRAQSDMGSSAFHMLGFIGTCEHRAWKVNGELGL